jgi:hypothetical protein
MFEVILIIITCIPVAFIAGAIMWALYKDLRKAGRGVPSSVLLAVVLGFGLITVVLFLFSFGTTLLPY